MKAEYDFSKGTRGKFYNPDAKLNIPIYLDKEVQLFVEEIAKKRKKDPASIVNSIIKKNIQLYKTML
ncbi:MAG: hypothetical protein ABSG15_05250 [FCB group bacterium]|jgi:hypothetical protein